MIIGDHENETLAAQGSKLATRNSQLRVPTFNLLTTISLFLHNLLAPLLLQFMHYYSKYLTLSVFVLVSIFGFSQKQYQVKGTLIDAQSEQPIPYATVMAKSKATGAMINGVSTNSEGSFTVQSDSANIYLEVTFIGYQKLEIQELNFSNGLANLGQVKLSQDAQALNEVEITAERSMMEFKLDKRVFNVGKDISTTGMGAMDVLENVPSVNVDIEGNVTLRGNSGVQILINGKPSVLSDEGSNALGSITADMIESVEVITNPSAKYEAGGTSGIINIVLKKEEKKGFNGSASVNTGIPDNHSLGASLNLRTEKFNFFTQFGLGYRSLPDYNESVNQNRITNELIRSEGIEYRNENFYNITLGADYHLNDFNVITLSGSYALELEDQPSETEFLAFDSLGNLSAQWERTETASAVNPKYQYDIQYEKQFRNHEDHVLQISTLGRFFGKELNSEFVNTPIFGSEIDENQLTETNFYQADYTGKLDYTNPITDRVSIEAGGQFDYNDVGNEFMVSNRINNQWVADSALTNNFLWQQLVYGFYATTAYETDKWGIKLGSRVEHTDLYTELETTNERDTQIYTNFFPSAHASYKVSQTVSFQAGYSRRIFRPRLWDLNPFFNIRNNYNIRRGNPDLEPEYADSYELTGIFVFSKITFNASLYHLYTTNVIERVSFLEGNVNVTQPVNVGTRNKTGLEINGKYTPLKWLTISGDFNAGYFQRSGVYQSQNFEFSDDQWSSRLTAKVKLPMDIDVEVSGDYQSGYETVQNVISGFAFMDLGIRKKLWDGKGVINASVRDVFATRIRESFVDREEFYVYSFSQRGRFITLGFSYSFGKGEAMTYSGRRR